MTTAVTRAARAYRGSHTEGRSPEELREIVSHMGAEAVEIAPAGADKGVGLRWLCAHLGIGAHEVMVFGDEINDLPMFAAAGHRVAVENANPAVRDAADQVAPPNTAEGVAQVIERLLAG